MGTPWAGSLWKISGVISISSAESTAGFSPVPSSLWATCPFFFFPPAHHPASCCHSISGKVSLSLANHSGALAVFCQALEGGCPCPELEKCLVFSCRCISNFWLFFPLTAALLLSPLCPRGPALLLSPCPTFVLQCCLCGRFLLFGEDVCFRLFCLCSLAVGTFLRSLLPFCLSLSSFRGWWKKRPDFWLILDFSGISVLTKGRLHCSLLKSKLKIQWGGGGSFSHPGHGWDF